MKSFCKIRFFYSFGFQNGVARTNQKLRKEQGQDVQIFLHYSTTYVYNKKPDRFADKSRDELGTNEIAFYLLSHEAVQQIITPKIQLQESNLTVKNRNLYDEVLNSSFIFTFRFHRFETLGAINNNFCNYVSAFASLFKIKRNKASTAILNLKSLE